MDSDLLYRLAPALIGAQLASFGWRVNREITVGDKDRRTWFPLPDYLNIASLLAVVTCVIILPIGTQAYLWLSRIVLGVGYILIAFHPITMAGHYRLLSGRGRSGYLKNNGDYPYATAEEVVSFILSLAAATCAGFYIWMH